jgi:hypothetical protein
MIQRKRTFLEDEKWRVIPWLKHPETKTLRQQILDILAFMPGLNQDTNIIQALKDVGDKAGKTSAFKKKLTDLLKIIVNWRWQWEREHPSVVERKKTTSKNISVNSSGEPLFKTIFWYQNIGQAADIALYNVVIALPIHYMRLFGDLHPMQAVLNSLELGPPMVQNKLMMPSSHMGTIEPTMEICRSIEYMIQGDRCNMGSWLVMLPLRVV